MSTGPNKAKAEEKFFRDLQKYEGLDQDFCDLLRDTERISKIVAAAKKGGGGGSTKLASRKGEHHLTT